MRFLLTVLVPQKIPLEAVELAVCELTAPYEFPERGADGEVDPATKGHCPCFRAFADYIAEQVALERFPGGDTPAPDADQSVNSSLALLFEWLLLRGSAKEVLLRYPRPNPACVYCHGTGRYRPDFNPKPEFDGISFGWFRTGWIRGTPRRVDLGQPRPTFAENLTTVPELLERYEAKRDDIVTNSLLTPDGEWFSLGEHLVTGGTKDRVFKEGFLERLRRHQDCWAVGLELHC